MLQQPDWQQWEKVQLSAQQWGALLGPVGAAVGGFIGGAVGYAAGSKVGETVFKGAKKIAKRGREIVGRAVEGIKNVEADFKTGEVKVEHDHEVSKEKIEDTILDIGFEVEKED